MNTYPTMRLSRLLGRTLASSNAGPLGRISDGIVRLRPGEYPLLIGLAVHVAGRDVFVHERDIADLSAATPTLTVPKLDIEPFTRRPGEVLLRGDVLGHRVADRRGGHLYKAHDIELTRGQAGWVATGIDLHRHHWWAAGTPTSSMQDWATFETLIGHQASTDLRARHGGLRRMRAADLADLLQDANKEEQADILTTLRADPGLEADVFEELDETRGQLLARQSDHEVAEILALMEPDDAVDALTDLPQPRRRAILELLPAEAANRLQNLAGYHADSAGGLMTLFPVITGRDATVGEALRTFRSRPDLPLPLSHDLYLMDDQMRLVGSVPMLRLLQSAANTPCHELADPAPLAVSHDADLPMIAATMADHNLITLPVVTHTRRLVGVITVDDILKRLVPDHWRDTSDHGNVPFPAESPD